MNIITISREFGSGGREVGKRLADVLGYAYYDKEIEAELARRIDMDEGYIEHISNKGIPLNIPIHYGRTFSGAYALVRPQIDILAERDRILKELAKKHNCVIIGRAADVILAEYRPFKLFVYADMPFRVKRCQAYAETKENLPPREMERAIKKVDRERARYYELCQNKRWGDRRQYHLCVNTTEMEIKKIVPVLAEYIQLWFAGRG